ncbi:microtubule organization protein AKNA [Tachysurus ichikawai]
MEGKRNTTRVRIRAWTPASGYSSPPSPVSSQLSWDEGRDEDFQNQMDENGIIGLRETQEEINEFEKLLKRQRLKPSEQAQGLSQLTQGQDSMEKAYLDACEKHQQVQRQTGGKSQTFDPDRELESLIFQAGIQLEELKEWIEQSEHVQLTEAIPSNPTHALHPFVSLKETEPQPENPACAAHVEVIVGVEVSSVSGESDGETEEGEEDMLPSVLHPLKHKHRRVEKDFSKLMDNYQDFRDFSKLLDGDQAQVDHNSLELRDLSSHPARTARIESKQQQRSENKRHEDKPLQPVPVAVSLSGPSGSSHVCNSMETLPEASAPASELPRKQGSRSATGSIKSHSSQGKSAVMGKRVSKENDRALRTQLQDGVVTPETDSGFLGSESSRLTPAAQSPVQRRAALRVTRPSVTQEKCRINPDSSAPTHTQPSLDASRAHVIDSGGAPGSLGRREEARMHHNPSSSASSSPLRWPSTPLQPWPSSVISELEQQSECAHSLSEDGIRQGDQLIQPSNQDPLYLRSSSLTAPYHHGDHLSAQSSGQLTNHHEAIESLQAEVHRLREHLEGTLRTAGPLHRVRAPRSPSKDIRDHTRLHTSTPNPQQRDFRERKTARTRDPRETVGTVKIEHQKTIPRRRSASVPRLRPEPDTSTDSDHAQFKVMTPEHIPASPVMIQTIQRARAETRRSPKTTSNRQKHSLSAERSDVRNSEAEPRGRPVPLCSSCMARRNRTTRCQARNVSSPSPTRFYSDHCPLCGATKRETPANQSSVPKEIRPVRSTRMQTGGVYLAVAPPPPPVIGSVPLLQCMQVCPSVLYYSSPVVSASYQKPLYISQHEGKGYRGHHMRSHSVDAQRALNRSLGRAIAAIGSVREMSERMVSSLSSGLHHMSPLAKSCTY